MNIRYISRVTNSTANALSRYPYVQQPENNYAPAEDLIEVCLITTVAEVDSDIMDAIKVAYYKDKLFRPIIINSKSYSVYSILDSLIYYNERLSIFSDRTVQNALLAIYHDDQNHFGAYKT